MRRALVTGGCGFIGSALVRRLVASGVDVLNVDALTYAAQPKAVAMVEGSPHYQFAHVDICNKAALNDLLCTFGPDVVFHLAAETHVDRSIDEPSAFIRTNIVGTESVLGACLKFWQEQPDGTRDRFKLVQVSTDEVFGTLSLDEPRRFKAEDPYAPNSPYSASKAAGDMLARAWHRTYGLPVVISHCSNNFGPWQFPEKLIPTVILAALSGQPIPVFGKGRNVRDWLSVDDHVSALLLMAERGQGGESFAVGGNGAISNLSLVHMLCAILDRLHPGTAPHARLISFVQDRPGHDLRYDVDPGDLRDRLGWRPARNMEDALDETVRWYVDRKAIFTEQLEASGLNRRGLTTMHRA